jgi:hypothetical protein
MVFLRICRWKSPDVRLLRNPYVLSIYDDFSTNSSQYRVLNRVVNPSKNGDLSLLFLDALSLGLHASTSRFTTTRRTSGNHSIEAAWASEPSGEGKKDFCPHWDSKPNSPVVQAGPLSWLSYSGCPAGKEVRDSNRCEVVHEESNL